MNTSGSVRTSHKNAKTMNWMFRISTLLLAFAAPVALVGCSKTESTATSSIGLPPELDEEELAHDHPETFEAALEQLTTFKSQIQTAFEGGTPDDAHDALHEIGHVLGELPELAAKVTDDADQKKVVADATDKLFDAYEKLDKSMHGGDEIKYESIKEDVDSAFTALSGIQQ